MRKIQSMFVFMQMYLLFSAASFIIDRSGSFQTFCGKREKTKVEKEEYSKNIQKTN